MATPDAGPRSTSAGPWPGKAYQGSEITVYFDPQRCRHFAECLRGLPEVFNARQRPWIAPDAAGAEEIRARPCARAVRLVAVDGRGRAGKSTLARALAACGGAGGPGR